MCPEVRASLSVVPLFFVLFCGCGWLEVGGVGDVSCVVELSNSI